MNHNPGIENPRYQALILLLRTADSVWDASRLFFARWNLSPSQFNVLNLLGGAPQGLSQTELSRELIVHRSNVTGLVDRLEKRGLVKREEVAADRRAYRVVLTDAGKAVMHDILPRYYQGAERVWKGISDPRVTELAKDLQQVVQNARRAAAELPAATGGAHESNERKAD